MCPANDGHTQHVATLPETPPFYLRIKMLKPDWQG